jgi:hypothetical protein
METIFALVKFDARRACQLASIFARLFLVEVEFSGHLAADFPQPFQTVIIFRFHRLFAGVAEAWRARVFQSQTVRSFSHLLFVFRLNPAHAA